MARHTGAGLPALPPGRHEAVPEGRPLLQGEVRHRAPRLRARASTAGGARKIQGYGIQLREKQKVKRMYGVLERQFRNYFAKAAQTQGHHRRATCCRCSSAGSTTSSTAWASPRRARWRGSSWRTATSWSTAARSTSRRPWSRPGSVDLAAREEPQERAGQDLPGHGQGARRPGLARARRRPVPGHRASSCRPAKTSRCRSRSS